MAKTKKYIPTWLRKKRPSTVDRLVNRLRAEGWDIPDGWKFRRCRPGHWMRSSGAWSWVIEWPTGSVGSPDNVKACLRAKELEPTTDGGIYAY